MYQSRREYNIGDVLHLDISQSELQHDQMHSLSHTQQLNNRHGVMHAHTGALQHLCYSPITALQCSLTYFSQLHELFRRRHHSGRLDLVDEAVGDVGVSIIQQLANDEPVKMLAVFQRGLWAVHLQRWCLQKMPSSRVSQRLFKCINLGIQVLHITQLARRQLI